MKKKILFVVNDASFFLSHRLPIALAVKQAGFTVQIATPSDAKGEAIFRQYGFSFAPISLRRKGRNPFSECILLWQLWRLYRKIQPDIVHHVTIKPVIYGGIIARLARVPAVVSSVSGLGYLFIRGGVRARWMRGLVNSLYWLAFGHPNQRVVFQNPDDFKMFVEAGIISKQDGILISGSGVDLNLFVAAAEPQDKEVRIVLVSRMLRDKGVIEFVDAIRILHAQNLPVEGVLVGDSDIGNPASIDDKTLASWHKSGVITWLGQRDDIADIMQQAHVVCLPSYREGLPKVLIEAAACGRPIITTDVPGCRETVEQGVNGLLVTVKNVDELAAAMSVLVKDASLRKRMGQESRDKAEKEFGIEQVVAKTLSIYEELTR